MGVPGTRRSRPLFGAASGRSQPPHVYYRGGSVAGMPRGKPSPKLAITVDPTVHEGIIRAAEEEGVSVSAWMTEAARRALVVRDGLRAVQEWEAENGPLTDEEMAAARRRVAGELRSARPRSA